MVMSAEPPRLEEKTRRRLAARRGLWYVVAGVIVGLSAVICFALGLISCQQAVALGLPAAVVAIAGLAMVPDPATGRRRAFEAGYRIGALLTRWRASWRGRRGRS